MRINARWAGASGSGRPTPSRPAASRAFVTAPLRSCTPPARSRRSESRSAAIDSSASSSSMCSQSAAYCSRSAAVKSEIRSREVIILLRDVGPVKSRTTSICALSHLISAEVRTYLFLTSIKSRRSALLPRTERLHCSVALMSPRTVLYRTAEALWLPHAAVLHSGNATLLLLFKSRMPQHPAPSTAARINRPKQNTSLESPSPCTLISVNQVSQSD